MAELRREARRDLQILLPLFLATPVVLAAVVCWRDWAALWPVWGTAGAAVLAMFLLVAWGALLRGRRPRLRRATRSSAPAARRGRVRPSEG